MTTNLLGIELLTRICADVLAGRHVVDASRPTNPDLSQPNERTKPMDSENGPRFFKIGNAYINCRLIVLMEKTDDGGGKIFLQGGHPEFQANAEEWNALNLFLTAAGILNHPLD
jgi:hypothetical protein